VLRNAARLVLDLRDRRRADQRLDRHRPHVTDSQALLATDQIIFGIIVIGVIGLVSDVLFKGPNRRLYPWAAFGRSARARCPAGS